MGLTYYIYMAEYIWLFEQHYSSPNSKIRSLHLTDCKSSLKSSFHSNYLSISSFFQFLVTRVWRHRRHLFTVSIVHKAQYPAQIQTPPGTEAIKTKTPGKVPAFGPVHSLCHSLNCQLDLLPSIK